MTDPIVNIPAMEQQIHRCALAMLPAEPNATWSHQEASATNPLGEPAGEATVIQTPVRVFFIDYRERKGHWTEEGIHIRGGQRIIAAGPDTWTPQNGDTLTRNGAHYRATNIERQDIDQTHYYTITLERIK